MLTVWVSNVSTRDFDKHYNVYISSITSHNFSCTGGHTCPFSSILSQLAVGWNFNLKSWKKFDKCTKKLCSSSRIILRDVVIKFELIIPTSFTANIFKLYTRDLNNRRTRLSTVWRWTTTLVLWMFSSQISCLWKIHFFVAEWVSFFLKWNRPPLDVWQVYVPFKLCEILLPRFQMETATLFTLYYP
jgi:hypothetical protein